MKKRISTTVIFLLTFFISILIPYFKVDASMVTSRMGQSQSTQLPLLNYFNDTYNYKAKIQTYDIMDGNKYITVRTLEANKSYKIKGYASSPNGLLYEFWVKGGSSDNWIKIRDYSENRYASWTPSSAGQYTIKVNVKDEYSNASVDSSVQKTFTVIANSINPGKAKIQTYDIMDGNKYITVRTLEANKSYKIKGYASSPNGLLYEFWVKGGSSDNWIKIRDYSENRYASWTPSSAGQYTIKVNVKDQYSNANVDSSVQKTFTVIANSINPGKAKIQTYDIMDGNKYITVRTLEANKSYKIKGYASSPNGLLYEFWVKGGSSDNWIKIRDYSENRYASWTPSLAGQYTIKVNVKDQYSNANVDSSVQKTFTVIANSINPGKAKIQTYDIMDGNKYITVRTLEANKSYKIKGYASSPNGLLYEFWVKGGSSNNWIKIRDYSENRYASWTPSSAGQYTIKVNVKDEYSNASVDSSVQKTFTVVSTGNGVNHKSIVIDPGHGGYDSGAVGITGIREKDVVLKVALKLGKILENKGMEVIYTRTSDSVSWPSNVSQDLQARVDIANRVNPNLYVSVHANSFNKPSANGIETYYYDDGDIKSKQLAQNVQKELVKSVGLFNRGVKTEGFYVLKNTTSPAILVELGFLSNRDEEALLNSDWFQEKCAEAIAKGILETDL